MSLARSASVPGSLTINSTIANPGSATTQNGPTTSGSLFGSINSNTPIPASTAGSMSLFANAAQKPAGGLFGANTAPAATTNTPPSGGGLFGQSTNNQQSQPSNSGGLFGQSTNNQQPQAASSGGLFGASATNTQTQQGGSTGSGGLFGSKPATTTSTGGGLFGNASANQNQGQTQSTGGGLFGAASTQNTQQAGTTSGGLFGQSTQQKPSGGLFSASTTNNAVSQPTNGTGGGLFAQSQPKPGLFGQSQAQPAQRMNQPVPAVQVSYETLRSRSRFDDLAQPLQEEITNMDKRIQTWMKMKDEIAQFMPQHQRDIDQLGRDVKFVEAKFRTVQSALDRDVQTIKALQGTVKKSQEDASLGFRAFDNLRLPVHYHQSGLFASSSEPTTASDANGASGTHGNAQDLLSYFNRICDDVEAYKKRLDGYRNEIERDMPGVENGLYEQIRSLRERNTGGNAAVQDQLGQVLSALKETGTAIVNQAGQIADTRERLSRLQASLYGGGYAGA